MLAKETFALVLVSPMQRARQTCELAGLGNAAVVDPDLFRMELRSVRGIDDRSDSPDEAGLGGFSRRLPGGESPKQIGARVDRVIARARAAEGDVALFPHGHVLRVLAARWIGSPSLPESSFCSYGHFERARLLSRHARPRGVEWAAPRLAPIGGQR